MMTYYVFYAYPWDDSRDTRHAQVIMSEAAETNGFKIIKSTPQTIADGWEFTIECADKPVLPDGCRFLTKPMTP